MITALLSRLVILAFGTLYPAYASYKAVRTKDVKEYVKWMMYWIVFALFTCLETFTDVLFSFWFPFYYELKVAIVFWLLSPATKGSSFLYRNFVHPAFQKRESEIDEYLTSAKEKGYTTVMSIGSKGVTYATNVIVQTAIKGGGGIFDQIKKSYSLSDLSPKTAAEARSLKQNQSQQQMETDSTDLPSGQVFGDPRAVPRGRRGIGGSPPGVEMYFSEVDVNVRQPHGYDHLGEIRSTEDISSGYSSTDQLFNAEGVLTRTSSVSSSGRGGRGGRGTRTAQTRRAPLTEDWETAEEKERVVERSAVPSEPFPRPGSPSPVRNHFQVIRKKFEAKSSGSGSEVGGVEGKRSRRGSECEEWPAEGENGAPPPAAAPAPAAVERFEILELSEPMSVRRPRSAAPDEEETPPPDSSVDGGDRKGRYRKLHAPPPPPPPHDTHNTHQDDAFLDALDGEASEWDRAGSPDSFHSLDL